METIIGAYDLDPNRVLDMLLDCMEAQPQRIEILELVKDFSPKVATQLLGFKFLSTKSYRPGLSLVTGWLIKKGIMTLKDLWSYLQPSNDQETITSYHARLQQALELRRVLTAVRLSSKHYLGDTSSKEKEELDIAELRRSSNDNQKFWTMEGLIRVNCWSQARTYLQGFHKKAEITRHPYLVEALCALLGWGLEPFYRSVSPRKLFPASGRSSALIPDGDLKPAKTLAESVNLIAEVLEILDIGIAQDPVLYAKVCRVLALCSPQSSVVQLLAQTYLLPALSLSRGNLGLAAELWALVGKFPVAVRYAMYEHWQATDLHPLVILEQSLTVQVDGR